MSNTWSKIKVQTLVPPASVVEFSVTCHVRSYLIITTHYNHCRRPRSWRLCSTTSRRSRRTACTPSTTSSTCATPIRPRPSPCASRPRTTSPSSTRGSSSPSRCSTECPTSPRKSRSRSVSILNNTVEYWICFEWNKRRCTYVHWRIYSSRDLDTLLHKAGTCTELHWKIHWYLYTRNNTLS